MTMITPSYLGETIEYSSLHACRSTLEDPTANCLSTRGQICGLKTANFIEHFDGSQRRVDTERFGPIELSDRSISHARHQESGH